MKKIAYLSLGSNLGDRQANLRNAIGRLLELGDVLEVSSLYETEPVEVTDQPWFLNCAVAVRTDLAPREILAGVLAIERSMGRKRTLPKGPRIIDIDILLIGGATINTPQLTVPHPAMAERRFVLEPLLEIAPDAVHPKLRKTIRELRNALPKDGPKVKKVPRGERQAVKTREGQKAPQIDFDLRNFAERYAAAWCSQNPANVASFFSPEGSLTINDGSPSVGRDAIADAAQEFMTAFPDMKVAMDGASADGGRSVFRWTLDGHNTGPGGTGAHVRISGYEEWLLGDDGLIARSLGHFDAADFERQLQAKA